MTPLTATSADADLTLYSALGNIFEHAANPSLAAPGNPLEWREITHVYKVGGCETYEYENKFGESIKWAKSKPIDVLRYTTTPWKPEQKETK